MIFAGGGPLNPALRRSSGSRPGAENTDGTNVSALFQIMHGDPGRALMNLPCRIRAEILQPIVTWHTSGLPVHAGGVGGGILRWRNGRPCGALAGAARGPARLDAVGAFSGSDGAVSQFGLCRPAVREFKRPGAGGSFTPEVFVDVSLAFAHRTRRVVGQRDGFVPCQVAPGTTRPCSLGSLPAGRRNLRTGAAVQLV
jgi:hypothetical protein